MKKIKKLNGNSLSELRCLMGEIVGKINDYRHVSEYLPKALTNEIAKFNLVLDKELSFREDEAERIFNNHHPELNP